MKKFILMLSIATVLFSCDNQSQRIKDQTILKDSLTKLSPSVKSDKVYFTATGTEPFWGLDISEQEIKLNLVGDTVITTETPPVEVLTGNQKIYKVENKDFSLHIKISPEECTNGMSGKVSPYTVNIAYKRALDTATRSLEGCGDDVSVD